MNTPRELRDADRMGMTVRKYEYDDETMIVVDLGNNSGRSSVDIVDDTAIVVVDGEQLEFEIPAEASEVTVSNGVLTIEG